MDLNLISTSGGKHNSLPRLFHAISRRVIKFRIEFFILHAVRKANKITLANRENGRGRDFDKSPPVRSGKQRNWKIVNFAKKKKPRTRAVFETTHYTMSERNYPETEHFVKKREILIFLVTLRIGKRDRWPMKQVLFKSQIKINCQVRQT